MFEHFTTAHEKYKGGENKKKAFVLFGGKKNRMQRSTKRERNESDSNLNIYHFSKRNWMLQ